MKIPTQPSWAKVHLWLDCTYWWAMEIDMTRTKTSHQMRWPIGVMVAFVFSATCSIQVRATQAEPIPRKTSPSSASDGQARLAPSSSAHADVSSESDEKGEGWLSDCLREQGGNHLSDANCYSRYQERLELDQAKLLQEIQAALSRQGPDGTDYAAAAKLLDISQRDWKSYVDTDCEIVSKVFGNGNAEGLASRECVMTRYEDRNEKLEELKQSYLDD
jgi:uncharacterized protein YecT (DUF1311 family)